MEDPILKTWRINAKEWVSAIQNNTISSRKYTNQAIVDTIQTLPLKRILDVGCGEGWLVRAISAMKKTAVGIDATADLLKAARQEGPESYHLLDYSQISLSTSIKEEPFDGVIFNFSLYQEKGLVTLFNALKQHISPSGYFIIQTLHPFFLIQHEKGYQSQWLQDSWKGLSGNFKDGHPWYARVLSDWILTFNQSKLQILEVKEILNQNQEPVSIIFILKTPYEKV